MGRPAPTLSQYVGVLAGARAMFPVAETGYRVNPPQVWSAFEDLRSSPAWYLLLARLSAAIFIFPATPVTGVRTGVVDAPGGAWGGLGIFGVRGPLGLRTNAAAFISRVDRGPALDRPTFAHEMGHALGLFHADACGAGWPHDARLSAAIDEPAFDALQNRLLPIGSRAHVVLSGPPVGLRRRLRPRV